MDIKLPRIDLSKCSSVPVRIGRSIDTSIRISVAAKNIYKENIEFLGSFFISYIIHYKILSVFL